MDVGVWLLEAGIHHLEDLVEPVELEPVEGIHQSEQGLDVLVHLEIGCRLMKEGVE